MKLCIYTSIGSAHVVVEGFDGFLFQLRGGAIDRHQVYKEEEYACGNAAANPETSYHVTENDAMHGFSSLSSP
jgi:hypothetical protein